MSSINGKKHAVSENSSGSDSEGDVVIELPKVAVNTAAKPKARTSVSAEAFGKYNMKEQYTVKVVPKSEETRKR
jgi:cAMP-dependent protein kinase regulator